MLQGLWRGEPFTFEGAYLRVRDVQLGAGPVQQPRVPLLIAGGGERTTLRQVARYADASNFGPSTATGNAWSADDVRRKYAVLDQHCREVGRMPGSILRSHFNAGSSFVLHEQGPAVKERVRIAAVNAEYERFVGTPADAVRHYCGLVDAGVQYFIVSTRDVETLRLLAESVVPAVTSA